MYANVEVKSSKLTARSTFENIVKVRDLALVKMYNEFEWACA